MGLPTHVGQGIVPCQRQQALQGWSTSKTQQLVGQQKGSSGEGEINCIQESSCKKIHQNFRKKFTENNWKFVPYSPVLVIHQHLESPEQD